MIVFPIPEFWSGTPIVLSRESRLQSLYAFEQAPRVDRTAAFLSFATIGFLPTTQGQRWDDLGSGKDAQK